MREDRAGGPRRVPVTAGSDDAAGARARTTLAGLGGFFTLAAPPPPGLVAPVTDGHTNDTHGPATVLTPASAKQWGTRLDATFRGAIEDATDLDYYRVVAPANASASTRDAPPRLKSMNSRSGGCLPALRAIRQRFPDARITEAGRLLVARSLGRVTDDEITIGQGFRNLRAYLILVGIGGYFGGTGGAILMFAIAAVMNFGTYWFSDRAVLRMYRARIVDRSQAPDLYNMVERLARRGNVPMPVVAIAPYHRLEHAFERLARQHRASIPPEMLREALALMATRLRINWNDWSAEAAVRQLTKPVLLIGGGRDAISSSADQSVPNPMT